MARWAKIVATTLPYDLLSHVPVDWVLFVELLFHTDFFTVDEISTNELTKHKHDWAFRVHASFAPCLSLHHLIHY